MGKQANCQVCVEVAVSDGEIAAPAAGKLYVPEKWHRDAERLRKAGVPESILFRTKPQIALELLREMIADGVARAPVLADAAYGDGGEFRAELRALGLDYFLQVSPGSHLAWTQKPKLILKQKRWHLDPGNPPGRDLLAIASDIGVEDWKQVQWKAADGSTRQTRLAWVRVFLGHGLRRGAGEIEETWLVVDWPQGDASPYHCYLAESAQGELAPAMTLRLSRSRWHIEQYFQRGKTDLGLDHYEGRGWRGFHHHLVLSALACLFVLAMKQRRKKNFWPDVGSGPAADPAILAEVHRALSFLPDGIRPGI